MVEMFKSGMVFKKRTHHGRIKMKRRALGKHDVILEKKCAFQNLQLPQHTECVVGGASDRMFGILDMILIARSYAISPVVGSFDANHVVRFLAIDLQLLILADHSIVRVYEKNFKLS